MIVLLVPMVNFAHSILRRGLANSLDVPKHPRDQQDSFASPMVVERDVLQKDAISLSTATATFAKSTVLVSDARSRVAGNLCGLPARAASSTIATRNACMKIVTEQQRQRAPTVSLTVEVIAARERVVPGWQLSTRNSVCCTVEGESALLRGATSHLKVELANVLLMVVVVDVQRFWIVVSRALKWHKALPPSVWAMVEARDAFTKAAPRLQRPPQTSAVLMAAVVVARWMGADVALRARRCSASATVEASAAPIRGALVVLAGAAPCASHMVEAAGVAPLIAREVRRTTGPTAAPIRTWKITFLLS